jgi:hypothetical protein
MSDQINDGGQAFPMSFGCDSENYSGMSLRDWFAGQALVGLLAYSGEMCGKGNWADLAFAHADAMIAARKEGAK